MRLVTTAIFMLSWQQVTFGLQGCMHARVTTTRIEPVSAVGRRLSWELIWSAVQWQRTTGLSVALLYWWVLTTSKNDLSTFHLSLVIAMPLYHYIFAPFSSFITFCCNSLMFANTWIFCSLFWCSIICNQLQCFAVPSSKGISSRQFLTISKSARISFVNNKGYGRLRDAKAWWSYATFVK